VQKVLLAFVRQAGKDLFHQQVGSAAVEQGTGGPPALAVSSLCGRHWVFT